MRRVSQQIGWSQESKLLYNVLRQFEKLTGVVGKTIPAPTTTTTSTSTSTSTTTSTTTAIPNVIIGTQTWTLRNLDVAFYNNGDPIPEVQDPTAWAALTTGAWCSYDNNPANDAIYGKLYNWFAVKDIIHGGLVPVGYHLPTLTEWQTLKDYLGGSGIAGGPLKETGLIHWNSPNGGATNSSGFTALPGGFRFLNGAFSNIGNLGYWWSSTESSTTSAWYRTLNYLNTNVTTTVNNKADGFSVRCLKD